MSHAAGYKSQVAGHRLQVKRVGTCNLQRATCSVFSFLLLLIILAGCAKESLAPTGSTTTTTTLPPPPQAGLVLGQTLFTKNGLNLVDANGVFTPNGIAVDNVNNRLYVADTENSRILGYNNLSSLSSGAPADIVVGQADLNSSLCNRGSTVGADTLCRPRGVAVDSAGNFYVADSENNRVLVYTGTISTGMAATVVFGQVDIFGLPDFSTNNCDQNGGISASSLCSPGGVAVDSSGNLYVADTGNNRVLEYDQPLAPLGTCPTCSDTTADHVFGQGDQFTTNDCNNTAPQVGNLGPKSLCSPRGIALDGSGNLYVADSANHRVLEYTSPLSTDTIADVVLGQANMTSNRCNRPIPPNPSSVNPSNISLCSPQGVAVDGSGNVFVADTLNNRVLRYATPITTNMAASNVFGQASVTTRNCNTAATGAVTASTLCAPSGVALDSSNNLYVADTSNSRILKYNPPFNVPPTPNTAVLVLGQLSFTTSGVNFVDASGLNTPKGVAVDSAGNLYVADTENNRVLEYDDPSGSCVTCDRTADRVFGQPDMNSNLCNQSAVLNAPPSGTTLCGPRGVAVDSAGNLYVADTRNNRVLEYTTPVTSIPLPQAGAISASTVFGQTDMVSNLCNQGGAVSDTTLCGPQGVTVDGSDNLYVADTDNNRVLEFDTPLANSVADRVFGQGDVFTINDCNNTAAVVGGLGAKSLCFPEGVGIDKSTIPNRLYVADTNNNRVLEYDNPLSSDTTADRVFGQPDFPFNACSAVSGTVTSASNTPTPTLTDNTKNFIPDQFKDFLVEITEGTGEGQVRTITENTATQLRISQPWTTIPDNSSKYEIRVVTDSTLCRPSGVAVDSSGDLFVADTRNSRVLKYAPPFLTNDNVANQVFGQPDFTSGICNNPNLPPDPPATINTGGPNSKSLCFPEGVALDGSGNLYVADTRNHRVLRF